jgi:hypothetical protein
MEVFLIAILIICSICIVFSFYMMIRNEKVAGLKLALVELSYNVLENYLNSLKDDSELDREYYDNLVKCTQEICDIPYNKMFYSFTRPLTIEEWLTDEQIKFLKLKFE